jgi:1,4-dihydroxy-2-naphthoate polyprenyltransferase
MKTAPRPAPFAIWLEATRPRTLPAAVAPVVAATGLAAQDGVMIPLAALVCLSFALLVQVGTNFANDYFDYIKGADTAERVGPRRAVAAGLVAPQVMKRAMVLVFGAAFLSGITLLGYGGWPLLVVGVVSIACGVAYTGGPYPLAYHGLGDVFVFVFFGLVAVGATYYVQAGSVTAEAWLIGVGIGALATNILVVNNYRDIATDRKAGKRTLAVRLGERFTRGQFAVGHLVAVVVLVGLYLRGRLGGEAAVMAVGAVAVAGLQVRRLQRAGTPGELIQLLGATGKYLAVYAVLLGAALALGPVFR